MTILFLARRFYPLIGGVEKHVYEISERLINQGHKVIIITEQNAKLPRHETIKSSGLEIYRIDTGQDTKRKIWKEMFQLKDVIRRADIIHCHDVFYWYLPFKILFPTKPVYTTFHGYEGYPITTKAKVVRKISEKLSWGNICIGDFIQKWYGTKPTVVSYGAVAIGPISLAKVKKDSAVFVGRLDEQTGILAYAKAVELVKKHFPKFTLTVIGDGPDKAKIIKKVNVVGFKTNPEKFYPKYHFAFVSRYLAILEAFAAKRLVFAVFDNPIKEDYLKMTPFANSIIIAQNAEDLKEKIIYYLNHPEEEKKLVDRSYALVRKQSWDAMVELYLKLWSKDK